MDFDGLDGGAQLPDLRGARGGLCAEGGPAGLGALAGLALALFPFSSSASGSARPSSATRKTRSQAASASPRSWAASSRAKSERTDAVSSSPPQPARSIPISAANTKLRIPKRP